MRFKRYIQGQRKGREANRIEREAMKDPFLTEALEGYDRVKGDHITHVNILRDRVRYHNHQRLSIFKYGSVAASFVLLLGLGSYFLFHHSDLPAQTISYNMHLLIEEAPPPPPPAPSTDVVAQSGRAERTRSYTAVPSPAKSITAEEQIVEMAIEDPDLSTEEGMTVEDTPAAPEVVGHSPSIMRSSPVERMTIPAESGTGSEENEYIISEERMIQEPFIKKIFSKKPVPVTGKDAFTEYIHSNMIRPTDENYQIIQGKVTLTFHVDRNGKPFNITIRKSLSPKADEEAIRLIQEGPDWTPGSKRVKMDIDF